MRVENVKNGKIIWKVERSEDELPPKIQKIINDARTLENFMDKYGNEYVEITIDMDEIKIEYMRLWEMEFRRENKKDREQKVIQRGKLKITINNASLYEDLMNKNTSASKTYGSLAEIIRGEREFELDEPVEIEMVDDEQMFVTFTTWFGEKTTLTIPVYMIFDVIFPANNAIYLLKLRADKIIELLSTFVRGEKPPEECIEDEKSWALDNMKISWDLEVHYDLYTSEVIMEWDDKKATITCTHHPGSYHNFDYKYERSGLRKVIYGAMSIPSAC